MPMGHFCALNILITARQRVNPRPQQTLSESSTPVWVQWVDEDDEDDEKKEDFDVGGLQNMQNVSYIPFWIIPLVPSIQLPVCLAVACRSVIF